MKKMEQNGHFTVKMETDVPGVRKSCGVRLHPRNMSSKVWSRKGWYIHLPSTSRTEVTAQNAQNLENGPERHFPLCFWGENGENFREPKTTSKDTLDSRSSRPKMLDKYVHPSGTQGGFENILLKMAI